ncbi:MAG TPA: DUF5060 domain-containing protein [Thermoanaerobaculia bacterium]|nr:DUF5060 domain-containing protein [Thermoanaerobaculia bacterium]
MSKRVLSTVFLVGVLALASAAQVAAVPCYGTAEVALTSAASYNASSGSPNPFDLNFTAAVTAPSGRKYTVPGFFDGNGAGGAIGNVWKVRIYTDEIGTWRWTTSSNVPGLSGRSGTVAVSGKLTGVFGKGPVVENPARPRTLMYQEGVPVFLTGKFLDSAASNPLKFSHTMFSEKLTDANRQAMLSRHLGMSLNKINVYYANKGDYSSVSTTPWVGTATSNNKTRFDLARWRMYDQWVAKMRDSGVVAHMWFFADDSKFGDLPDADRQRLIKYAMARQSAYVNTMFVLTLEWQEGWSTTEVANHANFVHANNPWARLVTVHGTTGKFAFPTASWADYMDIQAGNSASHATVRKSTLDHRNMAVKPIVQEEHGLGQEDTVHRQRAWAAFTGGAAGVGTGSYLKHLVAFTRQVNWHLMDPADSLVRSGAAYGLAQAGSAYVFYLYNGGTASIDLTQATGTLTVQWYDPRTGVFKAPSTVSGGMARNFTAPASGDWVLYIRK